MKTTRTTTALAVGLCLISACGRGAPPRPAPVAAAPAPPASAAAPQASASPALPTGVESPLVERLSEETAAQHLNADFGKLLQIAKMSPKTHKGLLKASLWKPLRECEGLTLVEVKPAPGVLVAAPQIKVRDQVHERLKIAGALAKQRGTAIEVVGGQKTVKQAVEAWNSAVVEAALRLIKAAAPTSQKEKSFAAEARAAADEQHDPRQWDSGACEAGALGGWSVEVQLVTTSAGGAKGQVLVTAGPKGERFARDTFEASYWDKAKSKNFRTLTEIMSAGNFVRRCSEAFQFTTAPAQDSTWRCKEGTESWDPPNRPIPAWQ